MPIISGATTGEDVFTDVTDELGLGQESQCRGAHAADINMDGWLDLYIVNMNQPNAFWLSDGEGGFTDGYYASGATDNLIGMGALFLDIENDGDLDLYLTHDANQRTSCTSTMVKVCLRIKLKRGD